MGGQPAVQPTNRTRLRTGIGRRHPLAEGDHDAGSAERRPRRRVLEAGRSSARDDRTRGHANRHGHEHDGGERVCSSSIALGQGRQRVRFFVVIAAAERRCGGLTSAGHERTRGRWCRAAVGRASRQRRRPGRQWWS
jgi:hypothetical protein